MSEPGMPAVVVTREARYFAALRAILRVIARSQGGTVAEVRRIAQEAVDG